MPRLILWDIDGTLVRGGRIAIEAYDRALRAVYGIEGDLARVDTSGKTDWQITLETLALHGYSTDAAIGSLGALFTAYAIELNQV